MRAARGAVLVATFTAGVMAPFLGKAFHMDEPLFLAPARHILVDFWHPLAFIFNWYGRAVPMAQINNTPPLMLYLLAAGLKVTGGSEFGMRLFFLPLPILASVALYFLAARFLKRPLLPTLICVAGPGYLINMGLLYPEVLAAALGFWGLYGLVRGIDDGEPSWFWSSAALICLAILAKYYAVFLLLPALGFCVQRSVDRKRIAGYLGVCVCGIASLAIVNLLRGGAAGATAWGVMSDSSQMAFWTPAHRIRSWLCFVGGAGVATVVWPLFFWRPGRRASVLLAVCAALLFLPTMDIEPSVRLVDRILGLILGGGALIGYWMLFAPPSRRPGWALWAPWCLGASLLLIMYWSIVVRLAVFCVPPLVFAAAEEMERRWSSHQLSWIYGATLASTLALSLALARVDYDYAQGQKNMANEVQKVYLSRGRVVWSAAHWGLQYYLERAGGRELNWVGKGWVDAHPGDVVVMARLSSGEMMPNAGMLVDTSLIAQEERLPLRLLSWSGEGGFYSNSYGFLPYCFNREPLELFSIAQIRSLAKR